MREDEAKGAPELRDSKGCEHPKEGLHLLLQRLPLQTTLQPAFSLSALLQISLHVDIMYIIFRTSYLSL